MGINWNLRRYTKEQLTEAVSGSLSYADVARKLGMDTKASPYKSIKPAIEDLGLDTSHFTGRGWSKRRGSENSRARPLNDYLILNGPPINSANLRERLIREGLLPRKCHAPHCPVPDPSIHPFTGEEVELKLALDHINGNNRDNRIDNLRLLCYHCHGLTDTFCRGQRPKSEPTMFQCIECFKPIKKHLYVHVECRRCIICQDFSGGRRNYCRPCGAHRKGAGARKDEYSIGFCSDCDKVISQTATRCKSCAVKLRHSDKTSKYPPMDELIKMLKDSNYSRVAKELGCSDNAIRKHLERNGYDPRTLDPVL